MNKIKTKTRTNLAVGVALISGAALMAAAAFFGTLSSGTLTVSVSPAVTSDTVVKGKSSNLLSVDLKATGGPVTVSSLEFDFIADDDSNFRVINNDVPVAGHVGACRLWDSSGTVIGTTAPTPTGQLIFNGLKINISRGSTLGHRVDCDFTSVGVQNSNPDIYALTIPDETKVVARSGRTWLSGSNLNIGDTVDSGVNVNGGIYLIILDHGNITASLDIASPDSGIVVPGMSKVVAGVWRLEPQGEAFTLNTMSFNNSLGEDSVASKLELSCLDGMGAPVTFSQTLSSGLAEFTGLTCFVSEISGALITVSFDTASALDPTGLTHPRSGDEFWLTFDAVSGNFAATGQDSGVTITGSSVISTSVPANDFWIHQSFPYLSLASGSPSGSAIPGMNEVFRFNVAANSSGDVDLSQVVFKIMASDNDGSGWNLCSGSGLADPSKFALYDVSDLTNPIDFSANMDFLTNDGTSCSSADLTDHVAYVVVGQLATGPVENIPAGSSREFSLYVDTTGASAVDDDLIAVSIPADLEMSLLREVPIYWTDGLGYSGGAGVSNLPLFGSTITY